MIRLDYNNMMTDALGKEGITDKQFDDCRVLAKKAHLAVEQSRGQGMQEWMLSPYNQDEVVAKINAAANRIASQCENFVVLGIGGSALGPIAVFTALKHLYYNELPKDVRKTPKFYVIDNVDPERMNALFDVVDVKKTVFNVITKSGSTSETMSQYLIVMDMLTEKLGKNAAKHIIATTSEKNGNLIKLANEYGFETFFIPEGVGGRFSELSPVGLLPAAVVGINIKEMLRGAREMDEKCKSADLDKNPALTIAVLQYLSMKNGKNINVIMPYADSLKYVADWYCQLWAESLGKEIDKQGKIVNAGQTPVKSLGVTDQHSQVQLYNEGPYDKVITFLEVENFRSEVNIPKGCEEYPNVNFLCGHTLSELMNKELFATRYNLTRRNRANYTLVLDRVNEYNVGALLYLLQLQTAYEGEMLNIDAYNQPGVEGGKNATYALFGRKGYEALAEEIETNGKRDEKYIVE
ncbi:MAG: glucose-6-phosphate isomerase [Corallococcus sp.]|nr:glucose-6-phosphate isomerase [Corallococcus sp.]MCM1359240.1 glucose-6-phosphate isomerase [Corallococcus sp.]MCM1394631.1 glucose-6-phosphate isomerase [Corallococcus sp.]